MFTNDIPKSPHYPNWANTEVSYFRNKGDKNPTRIKLGDLLQDNSRVTEIQRVREVLRKDGLGAYTKEKVKQPAFLVSALCEGGHSKECITGYTGLLSFDIDSKENPDWTPEEIKTRLAGCKNIAYCGLSLSGNGVWGIIPIAYPDKHSQHFKAIKDVFAEFGKSTVGVPIIIDNACSNTNRLRFCSYDPNPVWRENVTTTPLIYNLPSKTASLPNAHKCDYSSSNENEERILQICIKLIEDATDGQKHTELLKAARLAGGYIAGGLLEEGQTITSLENAISQKSNVSDYKAAQRTIRDGIAYGKLEPLNRAQTEIQLESQQIAQLVTPVLSEQLTKPISILKPDESQIERLTVMPCDTYPKEWDEPNPPNAKPTIKPLNFYEFQCQHPYFSQMGLASLKKSN